VRKKKLSPKQAIAWDKVSKYIKRHPDDSILKACEKAKVVPSQYYSARVIMEGSRRKPKAPTALTLRAERPTLTEERPIFQDISNEKIAIIGSPRLLKQLFMQ
jgi:hypothetical protein